MIVVNCAHPLTKTQIACIESLAGVPVERVLNVKVHFDSEGSFRNQARALSESIELTGEEWQTLPLVFNLPSHNAIAALLIAELHGRMGYFPTVLRMRPIPGSTPPQFEVVELLPLQELRDEARSRR